MTVCLLDTELPQSIQSRKRDAQAGLEAARARLLLSHPFFAHLALQLELRAVYDHRLETAATDGAVIFFSTPFFEALSEKDRTFILAHEVLHCVLGHHRRRMSREFRLWNVAADHEVNATLLRDGFDCPEHCILYKDRLDEAAEQIYDLLMKNVILEKKAGCFVKIFGLGNVTAPDGTIDPDYVTGGVDLSSDIRAQMVSRAMSAASTTYGSLPGVMRQLVDKFEAASSVPWQQTLRDFVSPTIFGDLAWHKPRRRLIGQRMYLPGRTKAGRHLLVAIDVSGSVFSILPNFLAELSAIVSSAPHTMTTVVTFDTCIQAQFQFASGEALGLPRCTRLRGGGGTSFRPVFNFVERGAEDNYDALIILTDGYGQCPDADPTPMPTLWALTKGGRKPCSWGKELTLSY